MAMKKQKPENQPKGSPAWMTTYGDMMTLLLTFFVLLFSMSEVDAAKFEAFADSFHVGGKGVLNLGEVVVPNDQLDIDVPPIENSLEMDYTEEIEEAKMLAEDLQSFIEKNNLTSDVKVEQVDTEVIIRFDDLLLFDTGKATIKPIGVPVLSKMGEKIKTYLNNGYRIRLEGHTDNVPIRNAQFPSNWELSSARAIAVAKFYIEEMDFSPTHISTEGFGEHQPIASNDTPEGRASNRRVEVKLIKSNKER